MTTNQRRRSHRSIGKHRNRNEIHHSARKELFLRFRIVRTKAEKCSNVKCHSLDQEETRRSDGHSPNNTSDQLHLNNYQQNRIYSSNNTATASTTTTTAAAVTTTDIPVGTSTWNCPSSDNHVYHKDSSEIIFFFLVRERWNVFIS